MKNVYKFFLVVLVGLVVACGNTNVSVPTPTVSVPNATVLPTASGPATAPDAVTTRVEQNGLVLTVTLPRATFWASEMVEAEARVENVGAENFSFHAPFELAQPDVFDANGVGIMENPWRGMGIQFGRRTERQTLKPGEVVTQTITFQVPATVSSSAYSLWVSAYLDHVTSTTTDVEQSLEPQLKAGPIPLPALAPDAAHQLRLHMHADKKGYQLTTTDGLGNPVSAHVYGMQEIAMGHGIGMGGLKFDATGQVNHLWTKDETYTPGGRIEVWAWAEGYAVNTLAFRAPGDATSLLNWIAPAAEGRTRFDTIRTAQAQFGLKLFTPGYRPDGLQLDSVFGESGADNGGQNFVVDASYRLRDGSLLEFSQSGYKKNNGYASAKIRAEDDAVSLQVGSETGYLVVRSDRWQLDWANEGLNFRLVAPKAAVTQAELVKIAAGIVPLP